MSHCNANEVECVPLSNAIAQFLGMRGGGVVVGGGGVIVGGGAVIVGGGGGIVGGGGGGGWGDGLISSIYYLVLWSVYQSFITHLRGGEKLTCIRGWH